jgi:ABC-type glycerol-3-phosphate transport system substrate-binding protein
LKRTLARNLSRRASLIALAAATLASAGVAVVGVAQAQDQKRVLTVWAGQYTPSRLLPANTALQGPPIKGVDPIVEAYEAQHPDVDIQLITQPINADTRRWLVTQLTGEVAPDIIWTQPDWAVSDYRKNWLVPLNSYLDKPNPYIAAGEPGSEKWHDQFLPGLDFWRAPDDNLYVVLADQLQTGFYYNKELFAQAGIEGVPQDWEQLMDAAEKLKAIGVFPFAQSGNNLDQLTWLSGWLTQFFYYSEIPTYDTNSDQIVTPVEMSQAVKDGTYSFDQPQNRARLEQLKRYADYWQPGAMGADINAAMRLFLTGRAGMFLNSTTNYQTIKQDPLRKFEFGTFYYPVLKSSTSELLADDIPLTNKSTGYGSLQFAVTQSAVKNGNEETAFDFLMFLTKPENLSPMVVEAGFGLPGIKNTEANPDLAEFGPSIAAPTSPYQSDDSMFDFEFAQKFLAITTPYLAGTQSLDETVKRLDVEVRAAADRVLAS